MSDTGVLLEWATGAHIWEADEDEELPAYQVEYLEGESLDGWYRASVVQTRVGDWWWRATAGEPEPNEEESWTTIGEGAELSKEDAVEMAEFYIEQHENDGSAS